MIRLRTFKPGRTAGFLALVAGLAATVPGRASEPGGPVRHLPASARIRFDGSSTLHDFGGELASAPFTLVLSNRTWSAVAEVAATDMDTGSDGRDRKMHTMMEASAHPVLGGSVTTAPVPGPDGSTVTLHLRIRDRAADIPVRITRWEETGDTVRFHADWSLSLKSFGLRPPSVIGLIRVADTVRLEADVTAATESSPATPARHE